MDEPNAAQAEPEPAPEPVPPAPEVESVGSDRVLIAMITDDGREPAATLVDAVAQATWAAVSSVWHPALLATAGALPRVESVEYPSSPMTGEIRLVASGAERKIPSGHRVQAEDAGVPLIEGHLDRDRVVRELLARLDIAGADDDAESARLARDFLALGTAFWWLRDLTVAMGHVDCLDHECLKREVLAGARAWRDGDHNTAASRLRASFEQLTQARERFYPVDSYILDLILLDPTTAAGALTAACDARAPFTLIGSAAAIEAQAAQAPESIARLREAISEGWADVAGGTYAEAEDPFLPIESIRWQYRQGSAVYREHLDGRDVETFARRRFGMHPHLPGLARRFGIRYALAMAFDAGGFPVQTASKKLWEGLDGTALESLTRPPLGADRASSGVLLPWRLARSMKEDHVAVLPLAHWPDGVAPWFQDLRRVAAHSPVVARWVTLNDFFHLTDRPWDAFRPGIDEFRTPYLAQAVARGDTAPISGRVRHHALRARLDGLSWLQTITRALTATLPELGPEAPEPAAVEDALERERLDEAAEGLQILEPAWARVASQAMVGTGTTGRPGYLVFNPLGTPRRATVRLPDDAAPDLRPEGPLRAAQLTDDGVWAVVELPAQGYAWIPRQSASDTPTAPAGVVSASGHSLRNGSIEVEIDPATGGLRSVKAAGEPSARLGQQLVVVGLSGPDAQPLTTRMQGEGFRIDYTGPALAQAVSRGALVDPNGRTVARFQQQFRLWTGRPVLEIAIELSDLAPELTVSLAGQAPWSSYLACRWAWPDTQSTLRRTSLLAIEPTTADRPETPDLIEIATRKQRTALLFGGLAHHQRHGTRMLDTLLLAGRESARQFRLAVALDLEFPFQAVQDQTGPVYVVPTLAGPPRTGVVGWLFHLDSKAVALTKLEYVAETGDGRGWGVVVHVRETDGRSVRCKLRCFRDPTWARQIDDHGEPIVDVTLDGDAVAIDLTPYEMARIEVTLG